VVLLRLEAFDSGGYDFGVEFCWQGLSIKMRHTA
jgi:hypothetical protein